MCTYMTQQNWDGSCRIDDKLSTNKVKYKRNEDTLFTEISSRNGATGQKKIYIKHSRYNIVWISCIKEKKIQESDTLE